MPCRILYSNLIHLTGAVIVPSSEVTSLPRSALLRPHLSDVLRFKLGWTIRAGENDGLDFNRGGVKVATIAAGNYAVGGLQGAAIVAALEASDPPPVWEVDYNFVFPHKFTILSDAGNAHTLLTGSGANLARSPWRDIGFNTGADSTSDVAHPADFETYQGRHSINVDLLSAQPFSVAAILGHNVSGSGVVRLDGHTATMIGIGLSSAAPGFSQVLAGGEGLRLAYFAQQSKRYLRLVIDDVQNATGYIDLGVLFVGTYLELAGFAPEVGDERDELTAVSFAVDGAQHRVERPTRKVWTLLFRAIDAAKKVELETFAAAVKTAKPFFFDFAGDGANVRYVFLDEGLSFAAQETVPVTWAVQMRLREALG